MDYKQYESNGRTWLKISCKTLTKYNVIHFQHNKKTAFNYWFGQGNPNKEVMESLKFDLDIIKNEFTTFGKSIIRAYNKNNPTNDTIVTECIQQAKNAETFEDYCKESREYQLVDNYINDTLNKKKISERSNVIKCLKCYDMGIVSMVIQQTCYEINNMIILKMLNIDSMLDGDTDAIRYYLVQFLSGKRNEFKFTLGQFSFKLNLHKIEHEIVDLEFLLCMYCDEIEINKEIHYMLKQC